MIYLNDEKTGVTVEDDGDRLLIQHGREWSHIRHNHAESLLRGLLRWKLETMGETAGAWAIQKMIGEWVKERSR